MYCGPRAGRSGSLRPARSASRLVDTNSILPDAVCRPFEAHRVRRMRAPVGRVALPVLGEPAQGRGGLVVFGEGHDVVALLLELLPGDDLGQVGGVEHSLTQSSSFLPPSVKMSPTPSRVADHGEDLVVGLGLAQRLDALLLQGDHPVVGLLVASGM